MRQRTLGTQGLQVGADLARLNTAAPKGVTAGLRYPEAAMKRVNL